MGKLNLLLLYELDCDEVYACLLYPVLGGKQAPATKEKMVIACTVHAFCRCVFVYDYTTMINDCS